MRAVVLHNHVAPDAGPDDRDTLVQVEAVCAALRSMGHDVVRQSAGLDLAAIREALLAAHPEVVVNLVETLDGTGRLVHVVPALLDHLELPYTGSPADPMYLTSNKLIAKQWMRLHGLPVPDWASDGVRPIGGAVTGDRVILKAVWEHASVGLDDASVIDVRGGAPVQEALDRRRGQLGGSAFVESFVDGREFNLSVIQRPAGWQVLAPAEIRFVGYPPGKPRIVGYRAKWHEDSPEYSGTVRSFAFGEADEALLSALRELTLECCRVFQLQGYARVDFRVDEDGRPWILEVNANPCLSPDAGLAAAAERSGLDYETLVGILVDAAVQRVEVHPTSRSPRPRSAGSEPRTEPADDLPVRLEITEGVRVTDRRAILDIVRDEQWFTRDEEEIALEVFDDAILRGQRSGYHFLVTRIDGRPVGFACFGPVPGTATRFDLYWIAVHRSERGRGLGRELLSRTERRVHQMGGRHLEVDTSGKESYLPTRRFYETMGYTLEAELRDFHAPGDARVIFGKGLAAGEPERNRRCIIAS